LDNVGGDDAISEIERDKLSLQEIRGFVKNHIPLKESMKLCFLIPEKELVDGFVFLHDNSACVKMDNYVSLGELLMFTLSTMGMNTLECLITNWSCLGATLEAQLMYVWI
jgi:hypothetical protein